MAGGVDLGDLAAGSVEADLEALDLAVPAFADRLGDARVKVVADLCQAGPLGRIGAQE